MERLPRAFVEEAWQEGVDKEKNRNKKHTGRLCPNEMLARRAISVNKPCDCCSRGGGGGSVVVGDTAAISACEMGK